MIGVRGGVCMWKQKLLVIIYVEIRGNAFNFIITCKGSNSEYKPNYPTVSYLKLTFPSPHYNIHYICGGGVVEVRGGVCMCKDKLLVIIYVEIKVLMLLIS